MSATKYLHISSLYRDRNKYPIPSKFEVLFTHSGNRTDAKSASDPIVNSYPLYQFVGNVLSRSTPELQFTSPGGLNNAPILNASSSDINDYYKDCKIKDMTTGSAFIQITAYNGSTKTATLASGIAGWANTDTYIINEELKFQSSVDLSAPTLAASSIAQDGYYNGYQLMDTQRGEIRTIVSYDGKTQVALLDKPLPSIPPTTYILLDSSYAKDKSISGTFSGGTANLPRISLIASDINGFYNGMVIEDSNLGETRVITGYDAATKELTLSSPFSGGWQVTDTFSISASSDTYKIHLQPTSIDGFNTPSSIEQYYTGDIIEDVTLGEFRTITSYDSVSRMITIDSPFSSNWNVTDTYAIRKSRPEFKSSFGVNPNPAPYNVVQLSGSYTTDYTGYYLFPTEGEQIYLITGYDGAPALNRVKITPTPSGSFTDNSPYEILRFSRDNVVNLNYNGSMVSQNQLVNYEIELISLILPNTPLKTGSLSAFYPYVFVQLNNISETNTVGKNLIYSNNPNAGNATFIAPIPDVSDPTVTRFLQYSAIGMIQTIKFKPNDDLFFSVTLPSGELFSPVEPDNMSPLPPKPELEITAVFSIKRL